MQSNAGELLEHMLRSRHYPDGIADDIDYMDELINCDRCYACFETPRAILDHYIKQHYLSKVRRFKIKYQYVCHNLC